jgi:hypothetical protein
MNEEQFWSHQLEQVSVILYGQPPLSPVDMCDIFYHYRTYEYVSSPNANAAGALEANPTMIGRNKHPSTVPYVHLQPRHSYHRLLCVARTPSPLPHLVDLERSKVHIVYRWTTSDHSGRCGPTWYTPGLSSATMSDSNRTRNTEATPPRLVWGLFVCLGTSESLMYFKCCRGAELTPNIVQEPRQMASHAFHLIIIHSLHYTRPSLGAARRARYRRGVDRNGYEDTIMAHNPPGEWVRA